MLDKTFARMLEFFLDRRKSKKEHDVAVFKLLDAIASESCIEKAYDSTTGAYWLGEERYKIREMMEESRKEGNQFFDKKINSLLLEFCSAANKLFMFYAAEGLPKFGDSSKQTVLYKNMDSPPPERDFVNESKRFHTEIHPKNERLSNSFKSAYADYRKHIRQKYHL
jgi:hypothetical protein